MNSVIPIHPRNTKDILYFTCGQFLLPKKSRKKAKTRLKLRTQLSVVISKFWTQVSFTIRLNKAQTFSLGWVKHNCVTTSNYSKAELSGQSFPDGKVLLTGLVFRSSVPSLGEQTCSLPKCFSDLHRHELKPQHFCPS